MYIIHSQGDPMAVYELANFAHRHLGPRESGVAHMLDALGYQSLDELTTAAMPENIAQQDPLVLPDRKSVV